jgi:thioredoxin-like negative regulator of GroEL
MKTASHRARIAAFAVAALALVSVRTAHGEIRWETKLARASAAAVKTNQPMLVEFWATWCTVCEAMDREVYADPRIAEAMTRIVPVRLDIDREPDLSRKYGISATPTLLLTDSFGNELFRFTGSLPLDRMVQLLGELPADVTRINQLAAALARKKDDFEALDGLARELRAGGFYRASTQYYDRALHTRDGRAAGARGDILVAMGRNALDLHAFADAARCFDQALREFPGRPSEPDVMLGLGQALLAQQKTAEARQVLQALVDRHTGAPAAAEATRLLGAR